MAYDAIGSNLWIRVSLPFEQRTANCTVCSPVGSRFRVDLELAFGDD